MGFNEFYVSVWNIEYILQLLVAEAICCVYFKRKSNFAARVAISVIFCIAVYMLMRWFDVVIAKYNLLSFFESVKTFVSYIVTIVSIKICFDEANLSVLFAACAAQLVQHLAFEVACFLMGLFAIPWTAAGYILTQLFVFIAVYIAAFFLFLHKMRNRRFSNLSNSRMIFVVVLCTVLVFVLSWYSVRYFDRNGLKLFHFIMVLLSFVLLAYQFSFLDNSEVIQQNKQLQQMLVESQARFSLAEEKREIINIKCHDIKKQLFEYGKSLRIDAASMNEIIEAVNIYDSSIHTGNDALDIILSDKALHCEQNHIQFSTIVDGVDCSFMPPMDLYALFGNMLDNAIEAVKKLEQKEKAIISLNVRTEGSMLVIHCENYFSGTLQFDDGVPQSTKGNDDYHGFGLKSIASVAKKYGGTMSMSVDGDIFSINVIMPVQKRDLPEKENDRQKQ